MSTNTDASLGRPVAAISLLDDTLEAKLLWDTATSTTRFHISPGKSYVSDNERTSRAAEFIADTLLDNLATEKHKLWKPLDSPPRLPASRAIYVPTRFC